MKAFLHESDDFVPLGTPAIVFLDSVTVMENHSLRYDIKDDSSNSQILSDCPMH